MFFYSFFLNHSTKETTWNDPRPAYYAAYQQQQQQQQPQYGYQQQPQYGYQQQQQPTASYQQQPQQPQQPQQQPAAAAVQAISSNNQASTGSSYQMTSNSAGSNSVGMQFCILVDPFLRNCVTKSNFRYLKKKPKKGSGT